MMPDGTPNPSLPDRRAKVRTCIRPDRICLQGGCLYCPSGTWKMVKTLEAYATRKETERVIDGETGSSWTEAFDYGWRNGWPNYPMKGSDS